MAEACNPHPHPKGLPYMERSLYYGSPRGSFYASISFNSRMLGLGVSINDAHDMLTRLMIALGPFWITLGQIHPKPAAHQTAHQDLDSKPYQTRKAS